MKTVSRENPENSKVLTLSKFKFQEHNCKDLYIAFQKWAEMHFFSIHYTLFPIKNLWEKKLAMKQLPNPEAV